MISIGDQINLETNTFTALNTTVTIPAVNGTVDVTGRELITELDIINSTNISSGILVGLFLQTGTGTNGLLSVQLVANDTASGIVGDGVNVSYTYNPDGYISDSGGRAITLLILIFASLAILVFVVVVFIKQGSMGELMRKG